LKKKLFAGFEKSREKVRVITRPKSSEIRVSLAAFFSKNPTKWKNLEGWGSELEKDGTFVGKMDDN